MNGRGRIVVDLTEDSPSPPSATTRSIPDSRFITPSDDSDDSAPVTWNTRKKKDDLQTTGNVLKSKHEADHLGTPRSCADTKKSVPNQHQTTADVPAAKAKPAQIQRLLKAPVVPSQQAQSQPPPRIPLQSRAQSQSQSSSVPRPTPQSQSSSVPRPTPLPPAAPSHSHIHAPTPQPRPHAPPQTSSRPTPTLRNGQPQARGPSSPFSLVPRPGSASGSAPNNAKPVSIVSPETQQWLANSQAQRKVTRNVTPVSSASPQSSVRPGPKISAPRPSSSQVLMKPSNKAQPYPGRGPPVQPSSSHSEPSSHGSKQPPLNRPMVQPESALHKSSPEAPQQQNKIQPPPREAPKPFLGSSLNVVASLLVPKPSWTPDIRVTENNPVEAARHPEVEVIDLASDSSSSSSSSESSVIPTRPALPAMDIDSPNSSASATQRSSSRDSVGLPKRPVRSPNKRPHPDNDANQGHSRKSRRITTLGVEPIEQSSVERSEFGSTEHPASVTGSFDTPLPSLETSSPQFSFPDDVKKIKPFPHRHGAWFTSKEDALIQYLKDVKKMAWKDFEYYFPGRRWQSLQSRYSNSLSPQALARKGKKSNLERAPVSTVVVTRQDFIPVKNVRETRNLRNHEAEISYTVLEDTPVSQDEARCTRRVATLSSLTRHRELGSTRGREWPRKFHAEIKDYVYSTFGAHAYIDNASGDVSTVAWSPDGNLFAAGAVAVTDLQSIQYNKSRNLMVGSSESLRLKELPEHKIMRTDSSGRQHDLFSTVQLVDFSPKSAYMYSVSIDQRLNVYKTNGSASMTDFVQSFEHPAPVNFLSVSKKDGRVATGCAYSGAGSIRVFADATNPSSESAFFSGTNATPQSRKYPSALRWGEASHHGHLLLAGFACEAERVWDEDDESNKDGEICLWDVAHEHALEVGAPKRNVFDVAWNPNASAASSIFAVASGVAGKVNFGMHSIVRLYSPKDPTQAHSLIELECPAWDINDVLYSPHDENIVTVGSTEGAVYIWDLRYVKHGQTPLRTFKHGPSKAILPHGKKRWEVDTGIRFLSWGGERDRIYSGSSDGVVKCWDPYRSDEDKFVRDVVTLKSAIMSGAFSPDYSSLLIGEDQARLNLLTVGNEGATFNQGTKRFKVQEAATKEEAEERESMDCGAMLASGALQVRPMGTMPFRQVVQGPNYKGPFRQDGAEASQLRDDAQKFQEKNMRMLQRKIKQLRKATHMDEQPCNLDCAHKPLPDDEREESGRSDDRIPDKLWRKIAPGREGQLAGLLAVCSKCGGAARLNEDGQWNLCERCGFACFRCGDVATISPRSRVVECSNCDVAWKIGVLGYELIEQRQRATRKIKDGMALADMEGMEDESVALGDDEREHFLCDVADDSDDSSL